LVSQIDILSSLAKLTQSQIRTEDSQEMLDVFMGESNKGREDLVLEATTRTAFRKGDWVMIPPYASQTILRNVNIELGHTDQYGLYNIAEDEGQQNNLAEANPDKLKEMVAAFEEIRGTNYGKIEEVTLK